MEFQEARRPVRCSARGLLGLAFVALLSAGCFGLGEIKISSTRLEDRCIEIAVRNLCVDFSVGSMTASSVTAEAKGGPGCGRIKKLEIGGWVDSNDNGQEDDGEEIEGLEHESDEGTDSVSVDDISLDLPSGESGDVHLDITITREGGGVTRLSDIIREW